MITIKIKSDFPAEIQHLDRLQANIRDKVLVASLNKTAEKARTEVKRAVVSEYNIKSSQVQNALDLRRASARGNRLRAVINIFGSRNRRGRSLNVIHFVEKRVTLAEAKRRAKRGDLSKLHFKFKRGGALKTIDGAFLGNRGRTVFRRVGKSRLPIEPVQVIDVPQMVGSKKIIRRVRDRIEREFPVEFDRALRLVLARGS